MAHVQDVEVEPPMHLQRPSSGRSQDVSHILASVFREVFTRGAVGEQTVRHLSISKSGDAGYHDKYVEQLRTVRRWDQTMFQLRGHHLTISFPNYTTPQVSLHN